MASQFHLIKKINKYYSLAVNKTNFTMATKKKLLYRQRIQENTTFKQNIVKTDTKISSCVLNKSHLLIKKQTC